MHAYVTMSNQPDSPELRPMHMTKQVEERDGRTQGCSTDNNCQMPQHACVHTPTSMFIIKSAPDTHTKKQRGCRNAMQLDQKVR